MLIKFSIWLSLALESFLFIQLFGFSNFLITTSSPNFSFNISSAFPNPSIKPRSLALDPDQNSPVNKSKFLSFFNFVDLLSSTTFIKSECKSNCIFLIFQCLLVFLQQRDLRCFYFFQLYKFFFVFLLFLLNLEGRKQSKLLL